ncbi:MAG: NAD(P)-binding domain-containing protein [Bacteroidaceae bacterium]|nr:NAD(P)-binding domain-containing protein [Bacteroidaceae bacterium]
MIGLLGSGTWATAIVKILLEKNDRTINWWVREEEIVETLRNEHYNPLYISEIEIQTERTNISSTLLDTVEASDDIYLVIPSAFIDRTLKQLPDGALQGKRIISAVKGLVPETNQIVTDYLHSQYNVPYENLCIISGPSHAEETAKQRQTYLTVASPNEAFAEEVRNHLKCKFISTVYSDSMASIQYATVLKNVYSVATGICVGLGYGDNIIAVLISNALQEMTMFVKTLTGVASDEVQKFAYLGDLLVTCYSQFSRNRSFGMMVGHGYSVKSIQLETNMVAEGYYAVKGVEKIRKESGLKMPIIEAVYSILYNRKSPERAMKAVIEGLH